MKVITIFPSICKPEQINFLVAQIIAAYKLSKQLNKEWRVVIL